MLVRGVCVGNEVEEKGVITMLAAWSDTSVATPLRIAGSGPLEEEVRLAASIHQMVQPLGNLPRTSVLKEMHSALAVLVPSEWYEPFGLVAIEAFASGTPVIGARSGGIPEIVTDGKTGLLFESGNAEDLAAKVRWAAEHPEEMRTMGENARREYEARYTPERNYAMLMEIYSQAVTHACQANP